MLGYLLIMGARWSLLAGTIIGFAATSCGGEIDMPPPCKSDGNPPVDALLRTGEPLGESTVLPNGRLLLPAGTAKELELGRPVDMIAHPSLPVLYVADAQYGGGAQGVRCVDNAVHRGIHVLNVSGTPKKLQAPDPEQDVAPVPRPEPPGGLTKSPQVCPLKTGQEKPTLPFDGAFGLAITSDGKALYASTGISGYVIKYDIDAEGLLTTPKAVQVGGFTAGLALGPGESSLFVVRFMGEKAADQSSVAEIALLPSVDAPDADDTPKLLDKEAKLEGFGAYDCVAVAEGAFGTRLWVSGFRAGKVQTMARTHPNKEWGKLWSFDAGKNPEGLAAYGDGVAVAVSDEDRVVLLRKGTNGIELIADPIPVGAFPYAHLTGSSPSQLVIRGDLAYVTLSNENALSVVDLAERRQLGVVPAGPMPSAVDTVMVDGKRLIAVADAKTPYGTQCPLEGCSPALPDDPPLGDLESCWEQNGSSEARIGLTTCIDGKLERDDIDALIYFDAKQQSGTLSLFEEPSSGALSLGDALVRATVSEPVGTWDPQCEGQLFPVPAPEMPTPIRHVILIVRENKTYDFLLGDLPKVAGRPDGEPGLAVDSIRRSRGWPPITPNLHALARRFTSLDNFYDDSEVSMQGHSWLTRSLVNDYLERIHLEEYSGSAFFGFKFEEEAGLPGAEPKFQSFFAHLLGHGVPFTIYGQAVGALGRVGDSFVASHIDFKVPPNDLHSSDVDKAKYIAGRLTSGDSVPPFVYVLLPRDHTNGFEPGLESPVSMIAENDYATGLLIDAVSKRKEVWESTVIFIVEDDPQQGYDHVDYHRSICLVVSPWAKPGHTSSVHASIPSLFHTIEKILGVPPMNHFDANAPVLWDAFTAEPSREAFAPFDAECPRVPLDAKVPDACGEAAPQPKSIHIDEDEDPDQTVWRAVTSSHSGTRRPAPLRARPSSAGATDQQDSRLGGAK